jgi:hypothetical protein
MQLMNRLTKTCLLAFAVLLVAPLGCSDSDDDTCREGEYQCVGQELQKCDADGVFQMDEMCGDGTTCMASMGHCHPGGEGGHSAGGHSAGGNSAGGMHMGGMSAGGTGGAGGGAGGAGGAGGN